MLAKIEGERMSITNAMDIKLSKFWEILDGRGAWHAAVLGIEKS